MLFKQLLMLARAFLYLSQFACSAVNLRFEGIPASLHMAGLFWSQLATIWRR